MTATYDAGSPAYWDEGDLRAEMDRVFDLCHGCRLCFKYCTSFPTLFDYIDRHDDQDSAKMTPAEQDQVVDECFQCKLCYVVCPYIPPHEWALDFPRLMLRANAVRHQAKGSSTVDRVAKQVLARTDLVGTMGSGPLAGLANKVVTNPGGPIRKLVAKTVGISSERVLQPYARQRFSTWWRKRAAPVLGRKQAKVALFPTCLVEYQAAQIGKDVVRVYERNGVEVSVPDVGCCGAPWLHSGNVEEFKKVARKTVPALAAAVRAGHDIVVPQPTCGYVLKQDYADYLRHEGPLKADAELIAAHTYDSAEYLWKLHKGEGTTLDTEFTGEVPATIAYHAPCHLRAQNIGLKSRDVLKLTGAKVTVVAECSAIDGTWGYREQNFEIAKKVAQPMAKAITKADAEVVAGDCHLAGSAIIQETGRTPQHPLSILARAYGIPEEGP